MAQTMEILNYMREHGSITPLEALDHCGSFRLGARIFDLKKKGYQISRQMVHYTAPDGSDKKYARYKLEEEHEIDGEG